jgi:hypothetical protein
MLSSTLSESGTIFQEDGIVQSADRPASTRLLRVEQIKDRRSPVQRQNGPAFLLEKRSE